MTQEEIQLLLKDLSARLSYGVICQVDDGAAGLNDGKLIEIDVSKELVRFDADYYWNAYIDDVKPYLRPMSSMTEEERTEIDKLNRPQGCDWVVQLSRGNTGLYNNFSRVVQFKSINKVLDYLNAHHFDYRGLIEKGLAIEVTKENNPYKK